MLRIEKKYLNTIKYIAKRFAYNCLHYQDIYHDLILDTYINIKRGKFKLQDNDIVKSSMIYHATNLYKKEKTCSSEDKRDKYSIELTEVSREFLEQEIIELLNKHLDELHARVVINWLFPQRKSYKQLSKELNISLWKVSKTINSAKDQLRKLIIGVYTDPDNC